jgi:uncharacterized protein
MPMNIPLILHTALEDYALPWDGFHGVAHWARVLENGVRLATETGARIEVVQLFAVLHDCRRIHEGDDPELLHRACAGHTHERTHPDVTIQTCWDADRLDLGRVGIMPDPSYLCTAVAKRRETIVWADGRASRGIVPTLVRTDWEIDLLT